MDDVDDKYHDKLELVYKKGDKIERPMEGLTDEGKYKSDAQRKAIYATKAEKK